MLLVGLAGHYPTLHREIPTRAHRLHPATPALAVLGLHTITIIIIIARAVWWHSVLFCGRPPPALFDRLGDISSSSLPLPDLDPGLLCRRLHGLFIAARPVSRASTRA